MVEDGEEGPSKGADVSGTYPTPVLKVRHVTLELGGRAVLRDVSLQVAKGETMCILGPSGSGKSQLLRTIVRLSTPSSGSVLLEGRPVETIDPVRLRRAVVMVQQDPAMLEGTVEDNLHYGLDVAGVPDEEARSRIGHALEEAFLDEAFLSRTAERLSGGERQRVALARALVLEPRVLLLDEPTAALDPRATRKVEEAIQRLRRDGMLTMVIVTHDIEQAQRLGDRTVLLREGMVIASGDSETFLDKLDPGERAQYLGELKEWHKEEMAGDDDE